MRVTIAKVDENFFDGEAVSITVPGSEGEMTVLAHHEPFITTLKPGTIVVRRAGEREALRIPVHSGVLEVNPAGATVLL